MISAHYTSLKVHVIKYSSSHYLVTPYIERKGLAGISREVIFTLPNYLISEIPRILKVKIFQKVYKQIPSSFVFPLNYPLMNPPGTS